MDAPPWHHSDRLGQASRFAAILFVGLGLALAASGRYWGGLLALAAGAAANGALSLLWTRLPRVLLWPLTEAGAAWAAYAVWQAGVVLTMAGLSFAHEPASLTGAFLLVMAAFLFLDHFGSAIYRSPRRASDPIPLLTACFATAGLSWALGAAFVAIWARNGGEGAVEFGLGALTFGSFAIAASAAFLRDATAKRA